MFTNEELKNLLALIARANITGQEAMPVAVLQQKINGLLNTETELPPKGTGNAPEVEAKEEQA